MSDSAAERSSCTDVARILLTTAPPDVAQTIARTLVDERLAACVNLVAGVRSVYRWEGAVQDDPETLLVIKTTQAALPRLEPRLATLHPYEVPEHVVLEPTEVAAPYLAWLVGAVGSPPPTDTKPS